MRRYLRLLGDQDLVPELELAAAGLDSLGAVALIMEMEDELDIRLPDSSFSAGTFRTVGSLWHVVAGLLDRQRAAS